jgi:hypothetical protein
MKISELKNHGNEPNVSKNSQEPSQGCEEGDIHFFSINRKNIGLLSMLRMFLRIRKE